MFGRCWKDAKVHPSEEAKSDLESKRRQESVKKIMGFGTSEWLDTHRVGIDRHVNVSW